jgi:serine/threonine-protein kinase
LSSSEPPADTLAEGTTLGRYQIRRLIGQGGMGCVYEAIHRDLKKRVAIKTLLPALAANAEAKERFFREGEAASRIRHPHVVDVTDVGAEGAIIYLVMEFLQGEDLSALIRREGPLSVERTADIMLPVMAAIVTAHDQGVVHRDLKPENIFLSAEYGSIQPKVLDFGISKVLDDARHALTGTAVTLGTAYYLPPEQLRGSRQADARGDQYALGAILYECLTGRRAFDGDSLYAVLKAVGDGAFTPLQEIRPDLPPALLGAVTKAMRIDPATNPSMRLLWQAFFAGAPVLSTQTLPAPPLTTGASRSGSRAGSGSARVASAGAGTAASSSEDINALLGRSRVRSRLPLLAALAVVAVIAIVVAAMRHEAKTDNDAQTAAAPASAPAAAPDEKPIAATATSAATAAPATPAKTAPAPAPAPAPTPAPAAAAPPAPEDLPPVAPADTMPPATTAAPVVTTPATPPPPPTTASPSRTRRVVRNEPVKPQAPPVETRPAPKPGRSRPSGAALPNNAPIVE